MSNNAPATTRRRAYIKYSKKPVYKRWASGGGRNASFAETIIMQCIVCGIMLSVVMLISIIKTPATVALRENIRLALVGNIDTGQSFKSAAGVASDISSSIKNIFSAEKEVLVEEEIPSAAEAVPVYFSQEKDFRIDEDIMESIYSGRILEDDSEIKNIEAPQD